MGERIEKISTDEKNILAIIGVAGAALSAAVLSLPGAVLTSLSAQWLLKFMPPFYMCYKVSLRALFYLAALLYIVFFALATGDTDVTDGAIIIFTLGCNFVIETYVTAKFLLKPDGKPVGWKSAVLLTALKTVIFIVFAFVFLFLFG